MPSLLEEKPKLKTKIRKRNGAEVPFDPECILKAITGAFREVAALSPEESLSQEDQSLVQSVYTEVIEKIEEGINRGHQLEVEWVQDIVELILMRQSQYNVAKSYILYRDRHAKARALSEPETVAISVTLKNGSTIAFNREKLHKYLCEMCAGLDDTCSPDTLLDSIITQLFDGITTAQILNLCMLTARSLIEKEPDYDRVTAHILLTKVEKEILGIHVDRKARANLIQEHFSQYIEKGVNAERLDPRLQDYDLRKLASALRPERDFNFTYLGLQTVYDRYLLHTNEKRIELPQYFWMRVAMGLALNETNKNEKAIEFYEVMSTFRYMSGTPTLFNSGTLRPQLSSCYLLTVEDDLDAIFKMITDNARLSKWAGGLGNDWTNIRATKAHIKGTNGNSQGLIPFLKIANDTAVAVNQGGKRKGAVCAYLEVWHLDFEEFLDLRKNTGDDRRRTHDMNTANWIPDLFMKRVEADQEWTLFSPDSVPDLHDLYGHAFETRYVEYEALTKEGKIKNFKRLSAKDLWRKMLSRLFETGHPWMTWKDASNVRSMQSHTGVIHSSNLCTEILLNTSANETAVCNLGSVNLMQHLTNGSLDHKKLEETISTALRMLDNVIDINYYPTNEAKNANARHRPVGLGQMGFHDALHQLNIPYGSQKAVKFADESMEAISFYAIKASTQLAEERGPYSTYKGSGWEQGLLPLDTIDKLEQERGIPIEVDRIQRLPWQQVRDAIKTHGMRNSYVMAIAPTATIGQIVGVSQSIEPQYSNLFVKSNLSGEFLTVNRALITKLKELKLWDQEMLDELKYHDGSIQAIERVPTHLKELFKTAFEIGAEWFISCGAVRQKWIDMGQSLNLYIAEPSGKMLNDMYFAAWKQGLKTTYYLRSRAATQVEKSTLDVNKYGIQPKWMKNKSASSGISVERTQCSIDGDCEACQ